MSVKSFCDICEKELGTIYTVEAYLRGGKRSLMLCVYCAEGFEQAIEVMEEKELRKTKGDKK